MHNTRLCTAVTAASPRLRAAPNERLRAREPGSATITDRSHLWTVRASGTPIICVLLTEPVRWWRQADYLFGAGLTISRPFTAASVLQAISSV